MHVPLLLPLLAAAMLAPVPARSAAAATAAACAEVASAAAPAECEGKPLCAARERAQLVCDLARALEERYVFFGTKRVGEGATGRSSVDAHLASCVATERAITREEEPLRFHDRLRRCTATLEDGHLLVGTPARLPQVALGVGLRRIEGRVVVANREETLLRSLPSPDESPALADVLAVGNEVLEIDGRPVQERLDELARHLPASSAAARLERAVDALTRRDFLYPEARAATLTVSVAGRPTRVELPWWTSPGARAHPLAGPHLRRVGIEATDLGWRHERARRGGDASTGAVAGALRTDPILPPQEAAALSEHVDEQGRVALRTGEVTRGGGRSFCYLQILTFHAETLAAGGERKPFVAAVEGFVRGCKERKLDVVLDLRRNEGGYLANASGVVAALLPGGAAAPPGALLLRVTAQNREIYAERVRRGRWPADGPEPSRARAALEEAARAGLEFTPAFLEAPVGPSARVGGYDGRVVALVGPSCMSACDRAAAMLRGAGRAVLLGEPTEGAGASQQEVPGQISTRWTDAGGQVTLAIPNAAMGVPRTAAAAAPGAEEFLASLALENRPVVPDLPYAPRLEDLTRHNAGWLARVEAVLFPPEGDAIASASRTAPPVPAYRASMAR